ncbi:MAG: hypothetical protein AB7I27_01410 [Bacteriovoracaceae bacterium]
MKKQIILVLIFALQTSFVFANSADHLLTIEEIEKLYPDAIEVERVVNTESKTYTKHQGPETKEIKRVNYDKLLPHLLSVIQNQQQEIDKLKTVHK